MFVLKNARVLDVVAGVLRDPSDVVVEDGVIRSVGDRMSRATGGSTIDLRGRTLMPGLIDAHVHVIVSEVDIGRLKNMPVTLAAARAGRILKGMLDRGFTTVRDTGGADCGLKEALATNVLQGPRLFIAGQAISQTGGHVDYRGRTEGAIVSCGCCSGLDLLSKVVDGVPAMLTAVRDQLRRGADHIKLTVSGGVTSPNDPLESLQFTADEISAAVQAATDWGVYVCAHAYSSAAISRALDCGVRSIEHGNLIDAETAAKAAERGAFVVPTLSTYEALNRFGTDLGMPLASRNKNAKVLEAGLASLEICKTAGVRLGFGTDLLGPLHEHQAREFLIRSEVLTPAEIIRSATVTNASLLRRDKELGIVAENAAADLIVIDGDPLSDLGLFQDNGTHVPFVMKAGMILKNSFA